ncbi:unnamed protein product [Thlaspi arvense]|uniref:BHLH domain-containing protein n=1 Tax=Thlaspi arvense TaxID=13288 RepID=A0AAU9SC15_THLAR|nr:unnamed protein product [Thlaspi arvense]
MMFLPSDYCCRLTDKEYLELVFENGQILAKSQRSNGFPLQNQRTKSIMDLYEAEYNEDFKKSIHDGTSGGSIKNFGDTQSLKASSSKRVVVDYEKWKNIEFIPPDEHSVVAERSIELGFDSTDFTEYSKGSAYLSSSLDDESDDARPRVPARTRKALVKRRRSKEIDNSPESKQRNDINKKMRTLQDLLPNSHKDDNESLLDEAINYMTNLQYHVQMMTMGNRFVTPAMMLPLGPHYSQMGLATGMPMGVPQFLPAPVLGAALPGVSNSADMLRFLNHPGLMPMQNSALFTPMENCFPQYVPPSCAAFPDHIPNSTSLSNLDDATTNTRYPGTLADGGSLSGKKSEKQ